MHTFIRCTMLKILLTRMILGNERGNNSVSRFRSKLNFWTWFTTEVIKVRNSEIWEMWPRWCPPFSELTAADEIWNNSKLKHRWTSLTSAHMIISEANFQEPSGSLDMRNMFIKRTAKLGFLMNAEEPSLDRDIDQQTATASSLIGLAHFSYPSTNYRMQTETIFRTNVFEKCTKDHARVNRAAATPTGSITLPTTVQ